MRIGMIAPEPKYLQISAQQLSVGKAVRYRAGNFVIRLASKLFLSVDTNGIDFYISDETALGRGVGDEMPAGTVVEFKL